MIKGTPDKINGVLDAIGEDITEEERMDFYRSLSIISDSLERCVYRINNR